MFATLVNAWRIKEIRYKILFTIFIILIFRIGSVIPVPFVDVNALKAALSTSSGSGDFFSYLNILTGGAMNYAALFAMSVTPYINASIIMNLLTVAIPALERIAKEGEDGQKKIAKYTRYATVVLGLIQGSAFYMYLNNYNFIKVTGTGPKVFAAATIILCFTAGTALMMWLGERIDEKGIGNGISILLFAGIISRAPIGIQTIWAMVFPNGDFSKILNTGIVPALAIVAGLFAVIVFIVFMTAAEHRIPIQYAKRVVGRKTYGGQNTHMPIKVNMSGVMPIIFASSILSIPTTVLAFMGTSPKVTSGKLYQALNFLNYRSSAYAIVYFVLIIAFAYFYTTIQYNPIEMANNLRKNSGAIPGIRPGKPTSDFISKILNKVTLIGALFLGVIAVLPIAAGGAAGMNLALGGTSVLIVVGVAIDTVTQLESQMMMRHYKGFLD